MKRVVIVFLSLLVLSGCVATGASDFRTILVMGNDSASGAVARNNRIHTRVLNELSHVFDDHGFRVFDETTVTKDTHHQGRTRRSDAELIDMVRSVRTPPIDTVALFTVYIDTARLRHTDKVTVRVSGRLLGAQDGSRQGNDSVSQTATIRPDCKGACRAEAVGKIGIILARDLGISLAGQLGAKVVFKRPSRKPFDEEDTGMMVGDISKALGDWQ